jgi:hypothetical protein
MNVSQPDWCYVTRSWYGANGEHHFMRTSYPVRREGWEWILPHYAEAFVGNFVIHVEDGREVQHLIRKVCRGEDDAVVLFAM